LKRNFPGSLKIITLKSSSTTPPGRNSNGRKESLLHLPI
jgi:hypothetical protein